MIQFLLNNKHIISYTFVSVGTSFLGSYGNLPKLLLFCIYLLSAVLLIHLQLKTTNSNEVRKKDDNQRKYYSPHLVILYGISLGFLIAVPTTFMFKIPSITNINSTSILFWEKQATNSFNLVITQLFFYEVIISITGLVLVILFSLKRRHRIVNFSLGYGIGSAVSVLLVDPEPNSFFFTIYYFPLTFLFIGVLLSNRNKKIRKLIGLIILSIAPIVLIYFFVNFYNTPPENYNYISNDYEIFAEGTHQIFYHIPFSTPPYLSVSLIDNYYDSSKVKIKIIEQNSHYFKINVQSNQLPIKFNYTAEGFRESIE